MNKTSDEQLLREYARQRSEAAFGQLVERHIDFVYSAARRMLSDPHLAEDVTQQVFVTLAQNASGLLAHPFLSGWLHRTARNLAAKTVRTEVNRSAREQQAATMKELLSADTDPAWDQMASQLDFAIDELSESEKSALLLRYFERRSAREIAVILGITEQAAQKRVNRAVENLRRLFANRGVAVGSSGLAALLLAHGVEAAPAGLAATVCTSAVFAVTSIQTASALALTKAITMTSLQKALIGTVLAVGIGGGWYQTREMARLRGRLATVEAENRQQSQLQHDRDQLALRVAQLTAENEHGRSNLNEVVRLRGELARLRADAKDPAKVRAAVEPTGTTQPSRTIPSSMWADAGFEAPEAALKTRGWCVVNGNRERFKESVAVTDGARKILEDMFVQMAEQSKDPNKDLTIQAVLEHKLGVEDGILMPMMAENQQRGYTGYRVVSDQPRSEGERLLQVETTLANGATKEENLTLRRFGSEWKVVIDEDFVRNFH